MSRSEMIFDICQIRGWSFNSAFVASFFRDFDEHKLKEFHSRHINKTIPMIKEELQHG